MVENELALGSKEAARIPEMDPYEELPNKVSTSHSATCYVPDPWSDEHVPSPGYIADSDSMEDDTDADSIDYPDEPEDGEEDDDEDPEEDLSEEHDPEDEDKIPGGSDEEDRSL
ncbi:hypothetical protein Tco_0757258 [Tanacetum coccineum]